MINIVDSVYCVNYCCGHIIAAYNLLRFLSSLYTILCILLSATFCPFVGLYSSTTSLDVTYAFLFLLLRRRYRRIAIKQLRDAFE